MWTVGKRKATANSRPKAHTAKAEGPVQWINYTQYLRSVGWAMKRAACLKRAGYRCQACNGDRRLEAHHRTYERFGDEAPGDLICLCHWCHLAITARQKARAVVDFVNAVVVWVVTTFRGARHA
jgi:predicted HNH restriction endonuclease